MDLATTEHRREDEAMAARSNAPLLITADTRHEVERLARQIHEAGPRARGPFVPVRVRAWPTNARTIKKRWSAVFEAATGGSVFLTGVEEMSPAFQNVLVDLIDELQRAQTPSTAARLISGTTVSLLERVKAGAFSERLFYRLNFIHLVVRNRVLRTAPATASALLATAQAR
jgi:two-component system response regulator PilR (NtrC family)